MQEDMRQLITRLLKRKDCAETQVHLRNLRDMVADWNNIEMVSDTVAWDNVALVSVRDTLG